VRTHSSIGALSAVLALSAAGVLSGAAPAQAATITVGTLGDFLVAVATADGTTAEDVIRLDVPADTTWTTTGAVSVHEDLRIEPAAGSGRVTFQSPADGFLISDGVAFTASGFDIDAPSGTAIETGLAPDITLTDMDISGGGDYGLSQLGGNLSATRVTVHDSALRGIRALGVSSATLEHVTATGNGVGMELVTPGGTVTITNSTFTGNGLGMLPLDRGGLILSASSGADVLFDHSTISGNRGGSGAGLRITTLHGGSQLTIRDSTISGNIAAGYGGGIASVDPQNAFAIDDDSAIRIERSVIDGNQAADTGGGIAITALAGSSTLAISQTSVTGNRAFVVGGAAISSIHNGSDPSVTVEASTFAGNTAQGSVGGLLVECDNEPGPGAVRIVNSTFSGNVAGRVASALAAGCPEPDGLLTQLRSSTITANTGDAFATVVFGNVGAEVSNSVIGGNENTVDVDAEDAGSLLIDYTLVQVPDTRTLTALNAVPFNLPGAIPDLGPLADNGGLTQTHLPLAGGDLVDAGDPSFAPPPATDQRGSARVVGVLDLGSVELPAPVPPGGGSGPAILPITGVAPAVPPLVPILAILAGAALLTVVGLRRRRLGRRD
jgi:hypothetical protein